MNSIFSKKEKLVEVFVSELIKELDRNVKSGKYLKCAIFLSGGSLVSVYSDKRLQEYLNIIKDKVNIYLVDERYTDELTKEARNDIAIKATNIQNCVNSYVPIIDFENDNRLLPPSFYIDKYTKNIQEVLENEETYKIALMGVGGDYHTAGIFPNEEDMFNSLYMGKNIVTYHEFGKAPYIKRITLSLKALRNMNKCLIYLKGEEKKDIVKYLTSNKLEELHFKPSGIYITIDASLISDVRTT